MMTDRATSQSPRQLPETQRRKTTSSKARSAAAQARGPAGRTARSTAARSLQPPVAGVHRPSWQSHRNYVRTRKARLKLVRSARRTWLGRHPAAAVSAVVVMLATPKVVSLASALSNPALGLSVSARFAEWMRDNGGGSVVNRAENWYYSHHQPRVGGRPSLGALPARQTTRPKSAAVPHNLTAQLATPAALATFARPALPGEGVWRPVGRLVKGIPAVYETFLRPDAIHTSVVDGVAWLDTKLLSATLYSGSYIPGGGPYKYTAPIEPAAAHSLVAAFNAGFRMQDANGGYYTQGKTIIALRSGAASFVIYKNGSATIGSWGSDVAMSSDVVAVRQNLNLLVDNGAPVPGLNANDTTQWGNTLGNAVYVSRSGIGVTRDGALVYVGGPDLNITDLANLLVRAGAIRAMELDINTDWVNFATFAPSTSTGLAAPANGTDLLPLADMAGPPTRYFLTWSAARLHHDVCALNDATRHRRRR